jgi:hypothetical protein
MKSTRAVNQKMLKPETPVSAAIVTKNVYTVKNVPLSYEKEVSAEIVP